MNRNKLPGCRQIPGLLAALTLAACNGAGATNTSALPSVPQSGSPSPPVTQPPDPAPQISGSPSAKAVVGQPFSFLPNATNSDSDHLSFSIANQPSWTSFDSATGHLWGTPQAADVGAHDKIVISVSDGMRTQALPQFALTVVLPRKSNYGHYFATHYSDTPADAAMLCEQAGVSGVVWRQTWKDVEPTAGIYDFSSFDQVLAAISASRNPKCQLWLFVEFKSFNNSPVKNPCPVYLQAQHSGLNSIGNGAASCFMWEPGVVSAFVAMMKAAAARFDKQVTRRRIHHSGVVTRFQWKLLAVCGQWRHLHVHRLA